MSHVVLLGDSIFDNAAYVPGGPPVVEQTRQALPAGWRVTLLAVDGATSRNVPDQARRLPADATHLVVSAGGNDALGVQGLLGEPASSVGAALARLQREVEHFREAYRAMLRALLRPGKPMAVCTIYDAVPGLGPAQQAGLASFNAVILRDAAQAGLPVIDLRLTCDRAEDYSEVSPIEPSAAGGAKIARAIAGLVTRHDFSRAGSVIYT